ncbi:hypothetical protein OPQ81_010480 [Rhizoctonia solani]|nr:hypothetical protein OPQ81_010480 [Rhizoctonia solani]
MSSPSKTNGPVYQAIHEKLTRLLNPVSMEITNDSWQHRHHTAMRESGGGNGETHFTVWVVSDSFIGKTTMQRHRMIYGALSEELAQGVHALDPVSDSTDPHRLALDVPNCIPWIYILSLDLQINQLSLGAKITHDQSKSSRIASIQFALSLPIHERQPLSALKSAHFLATHSPKLQFVQIHCTSPRDTTHRILFDWRDHALKYRKRHPDPP